jgi:GDP-L-fucose synthase
MQRLPNPHENLDSLYWAAKEKNRMMSNEIFSIADKRVWVAGHRGMVGSALVRRLATESCHLLTATRAEVDLIRQADVENWMSREKPEVIFLAAAKVGGIQANNSMPAAFLYENLMIEANIIHAAKMTGVQKLVFLGSTCIYPKMAPQPIPEEALLTGPLEPTNEWYAIAKIAGIKLCQSYRRQYGCDFIAAQPTNLYGPGDNYDLNTSHVLPALLRKAHEAKISGASTMTVWGSGTPKREFLHVDDLADATVFLAKNYSDEGHINIGSGEEISIRELAELICQTVGFKGKIIFDATKPDGTPRKLSDTSKLKSLGWDRAKTLAHGLKDLYAVSFGSMVSVV